MRQRQHYRQQQTALLVTTIGLAILCWGIFADNTPLLLISLLTCGAAVIISGCSLARDIKRCWNLPFKAVIHFDLCSILPGYMFKPGAAKTLASCGREVKRPTATADLAEVTCRPCRSIGSEQLEISRKYGCQPSEYSDTDSL